MGSIGGGGGFGVVGVGGLISAFTFSYFINNNIVHLYAVCASCREKRHATMHCCFCGTISTYAFYTYMEVLVFDTIIWFAIFRTHYLDALAHTQTLDWNNGYL